ncbi:hypothetical protein [Nocardioides sambongensis]|uniref:hypothetical protein n=1 Tax=Nocardioides sambongensis TaxID=2589074 RepID=UPI001E433D86|nr:hypothetical protein [Nocardioides sambongensis]
MAKNASAASAVDEIVSAVVVASLVVVLVLVLVAADVLTLDEFEELAVDSLAVPAPQALSATPPATTKAAIRDLRPNRRS